MNLNKRIIEQLLLEAKKAREQAYAPYSNFKVGAALITESGSVYTGCNVENASYGLTICAERTAIVKAISNGERNIKAIAVIAGENEIARPCGACLQFLSEFSLSDSSVTIIASSLDGKYDVKTLKDYLPMGFKLV